MAVTFPLLFLLASQLLVVSVVSRTFTIENKCEETIWPASYSYAGSVNTPGFQLEKGGTRVINVSSLWIGHFWGRTLCTTNSTGSFSCTTGDCGRSSKVECSTTASLLPPLTLAEFLETLAEFNLANDGGDDYYDVNVVNGYNLPMVVTPENKKCESIGCVIELNKTCPSEMRMRSVDINSNDPFACNTSCQINQVPEVCSVGLYVADKDIVPPNRCSRTIYSETFKNACPSAYSFAYDSDISTFKCRHSSNFIITFCPPSTVKTGKFPLKLTLIIGISSVLGVIIIIAIMVKVRANNVRKRDWNEKNIDAVVMLKRFSYVEVKKMTKSFVDVLGKGGFGTVYKGKLLDGSRDVAVKIMKESNGNGEDFINEVASMSRTSHVNIVPLLGFCYERNKKAIIYEFMPNGSLDKFISEKMSTKMEWKTLYNIYVGVSRGLDYLHNRCVSRIVHFDIKPQNILMDGEFCPKISDFGLAKLSKVNESIMSMQDTRGTAGYIAPEVFSKKFGGVSHKSDVYSYGMVVLEMIGAKNIEKAQDAGSNNSSMYFPDWIYKDLVDGEIMSFFADQINDEEDEKILKQMVLVGLWCIQTNPLDRPPMSKVVEMLEGSLEALQIPPEPLLCLPAMTVRTNGDEIQESSSFSKLSQDTSNYLEKEVQDDTEVNQDSLRSS